MDGGRRNDMSEEENTARKAVEKNKLKWRRRQNTSDTPEVDPVFPSAISESAPHRMQPRPRKSCTIMGTERHDLFGPVRELFKEIFGSSVNKFVVQNCEIPSGRRTPFASVHKPGPSNYHATDHECSNDSEMKSKSSLYSGSRTMGETSLNESEYAEEVMDENSKAADNQTSSTQYKLVEKCRIPGGGCDLPAFAGYGYCIYHTPQMKFIQCRYDAGTRVNRCPNGVSDVRFGLCDEHKMALVEIVLAEERAAKLEEGGYADGRKFRAFLRRLKLPTYSSGYGTNFDDSFSTDSDSETEDGVSKCATPDYDYSSVLDDNEPLSCLGIANVKKLIRIIHDEKGTKRNRLMDYLEIALLAEQQRKEAQKQSADKNENLSEKCVQPNYAGSLFFNELYGSDQFIHPDLHPEMEQADYVGTFAGKRTSQPLLSLIGRKRIPPLDWNTYYRHAKRLEPLFEIRALNGDVFKSIVLDLVQFLMRRYEEL
ncbi:putative phospholipase D domain protein [Trichinella spiralis]|uniref:putative phospholipase D domain protein n=1 Tax=Trichinella spiralis TaxID=6334 RepID=UPI0001EFF025|nr:putative phospholipase D domain protein [Trichinella spiralis]